MAARGTRAAFEPPCPRSFHGRDSLGRLRGASALAGVEGCYSNTNPRAGGCSNVARKGSGRICWLE